MLSEKVREELEYVCSQRKEDKNRNLWFVGKWITRICIGTIVALVCLFTSWFHYPSVYTAVSFVSTVLVIPCLVLIYISYGVGYYFGGVHDIKERRNMCQIAAERFERGDMTEEAYTAIMILYCD